MPIVITNKDNIPDVFMRAAKVDRHITKGDISTTQIIDAPQIRYLLAHHEVEQDVSERLHMLAGTAMHHILERAEVAHYNARMLMDASTVLRDTGRETDRKAADYLVKLAKKDYPEAFDNTNLIEQTLSLQIQTELGPLELSATIDKYWGEKKHLSDYKNTSTWAYIYEESKKKWEAQQNVYACILREHGYPVESASITALFRDWSASNMKRNKDYPKSMAMDIPIKLYPHERMMSYLKKKATLHMKMIHLGEVPKCTPKERWAEPASWAARRKGAKKAMKVMPEESLIDEYIEAKSLQFPDIQKEYRPGSNKRCEHYCPVRDVCPQRKEFNEKYPPKK